VIGPQRRSEPPTMALGVACLVLALAVLHVSWVSDDLSTSLPGVAPMSIDIGNVDHHPAMDQLGPLRGCQL
jgi:hypothetical protein